MLERLPTRAARWMFALVAAGVALHAAIFLVALAGPAALEAAARLEGTLGRLGGLGAYALLGVAPGAALWLLPGERARKARDRAWVALPVLLALALLGQLAAHHVGALEFRAFQESGAALGAPRERVAPVSASTLSFLATLLLAASAALAIALAAREKVDRERSLVAALAAYVSVVALLPAAWSLVRPVFSASYVDFTLAMLDGYGVVTTFAFLVPALVAHRLIGFPNPRFVQGAALFLALATLAWLAPMGWLVWEDHRAITLGESPRTLWDMPGYWALQVGRDLVLHLVKVSAVLALVLTAPEPFRADAGPSRPSEPP